MMISSTCSGLTPARRMASATAVLPSVTAETLFKAPWNEPTAVRQADAITTSVFALMLRSPFAESLSCLCPACACFECCFRAGQIRVPCGYRDGAGDCADDDKFFCHCILFRHCTDSSAVFHTRGPSLWPHKAQREASLRRQTGGQSPIPNECSRCDTIVLRIGTYCNSVCLACPWGGGVASRVRPSFNHPWKRPFTPQATAQFKATA